MEILNKCNQELQRYAENINITIPPMRALPPAAERALVKMTDRFKLRPFNKHNVLYYYLPMQGLVSYSALSINVMNPNLFSILSHRNVTNVLLLSAGSGAGLWLWGKTHTSAVAPARRFSWAFLCGSMWSLGSILLWAVLRTSLGNRPTIATVLGLTSGAALTYTGIDYFDYVDLLLTGGITIQDDLSEGTVHSEDDKFDLDL